MLGAGSGSVITDLNRLASHQSLLALTFVTSVPLFDQSCTLTDNRTAYLIVTCLFLKVPSLVQRVGFILLPECFSRAKIVADEC